MSDSERSGSPIRRHDKPTLCHPYIADESEPRSESSGARRPAANLRVYRSQHSISRRACACVNHLRPAAWGLPPSNRFAAPQRRSLARLGVLAPMPITCAMRRWGLPPSDRLAAPQRRSLARLGVLAPTPITLRPAGLRSWGRNVSGAAGVGQRTQRFAYSEARRAYTLPLPTLPTRANRGVSRPAPAAPVPPRTYECIEHRTLFLGMLAPTPITLRPAGLGTALFGQICCSSAPVASRLGVLAPMPISLRLRLDFLGAQCKRGRRVSDSERSGSPIRRHDEPTLYRSPHCRRERTAE